ncbi:hypothetical protein CLV92_10215 [Kineococcus xinjiangensis]|uniref:Uncharacterized protein n=1 Tax=Kineococcus xinjiangensis TaxID=512762 RepID=A0A2S6IUB7_9ACTN|nr:hypothetical protein CLV92_10215 [Kineococcus xinjiangensis]
MTFGEGLGPSVRERVEGTAGQARRFAAHAS